MNTYARGWFQHGMRLNTARVSEVDIDWAADIVFAALSFVLREANN